MKISQNQVTKLTISDVPNLDAVDVIVEDFGPGQGEITITCFGEAWSYYWSHMGEDTKLTDFFLKASTPYIVGKLKVGISATIDNDDSEELEILLKKEIIRMRRCNDLSADQAREFYNDAAGVEWGERGDICSQVFGDEWWERTPKKPNPDYEHLCRIIQTVKEAFERLKTAS